MKKLLFLSAVASMLAITVNAQKFYLKAGGGYILPSSGSAYNNADPNGLTSIQPSTSIAISADGSTATVKSLNGSLGTGCKFGLAGGYQFTKNIAAELAVNYFDGDKILIGKYSSPLANQKEVAYVKGFDISPTIVLRANAKMIDPYVRAGLIFTGPGNLWIRTYVDEPNGGGAGTAIAVRAKTKVDSRFSVGILSAAGVNINLGKRFSIFSEAEYKAFSITSKSAAITDYTTSAINNGVKQNVAGEQLSDLPVYQMNFVFSNTFQQPANTTTIDLTQPRILPTQKVNMSGIGLNIGVTWKL